MVDDRIGVIVAVFTIFDSATTTAAAVDGAAEGVQVGGIARHLTTSRGSATGTRWAKGFDVAVSSLCLGDRRATVALPIRTAATVMFEAIRQALAILVALLLLVTAAATCLSVILLLSAVLGTLGQLGGHGRIVVGAQGVVRDVEILILLFEIGVLASQMVILASKTVQLVLKVLVDGLVLSFEGFIICPPLLDFVLGILISPLQVFDLGLEILDRRGLANVARGVDRDGRLPLGLLELAFVLVSVLASLVELGGEVDNKLRVGCIRISMRGHREKTRRRTGLGPATRARGGPVSRRHDEWLAPSARERRIFSRKRGTW